MVKQDIPTKKIFDFSEEDRNFGGDFLFVDLIPSSCWFTNVRSSVSKKDWDSIRKFIYKRADFQCEICKNTHEQLEAHERWEYNEVSSVQKLKRIICLCHSCHQATHLGFAITIGKERQALDHIKKVNGWTEEDAQYHKEAAFETWYKRCQKQWKLDISLLEKENIQILQPSL